MTDNARILLLKTINLFILNFRYFIISTLYPTIKKMYKKSATEPNSNVLTFDNYLSSCLFSKFPNMSFHLFCFVFFILSFSFICRDSFALSNSIDYDSKTNLLTARLSAKNIFYVDAINGNDKNRGSITAPFKTLTKSLEVVSALVDKGITSNKIYLRGGIYRNDGFSKKPSERNFTLYNVNLKGTSEDRSVISAMPCSPNTPGAVQRKSGQWYEKVVFDDGYIIPSGKWIKYRENIWQANLGYLNIKWGKQQRPDKRGGGISWMAGANSDFLAIGPRMVLQDGKALLWEDPWPKYNPLTDKYSPNPLVNPAVVLTGPGTRTYDQNTKTLYVWPFDNKDPNTVKMESWKGTTPDVRFRHLLNGNMEHVEIRGVEFRLILSIFNDGVLSQPNFTHLLWEDNLFSYCWKNIFQDATGAKYISRIKNVPRNNWHIRYNVFFRPSREVFQTWGDNHIFEFNDVIEHAGPWAGGATGFGVVQLQHMNKARVSHNYIQHVGNKWCSGSAINIEALDSRDKNGDCLYGDIIFEHNFINIKRGGVMMVLGQGGCRLRNITIRNNIFAENPGDGVRWGVGHGIDIPNPHTNLQIYNNVFYKIKRPFVVKNDRGGMKLENMPSSISIHDNILMGNNLVNWGDIIPSRLSKVAAIDKNLYFNNSGSAVGTNAIIGDPIFTNAKKFNFTLQQGSPAIQPNSDIGAYEYGQQVPIGTEWWLIKERIDSFWK